MNTTLQERSLRPGLTDQQEGEVVHRKLENFASEYYTLLQQQLHQQRMFYQERLEQMKQQHQQKQKSQQQSTSDLIWALKQERNQLEQRFMTLKTKYQKVTKDVEFLSHMNEGLEKNKPAMEREIHMIEKERVEAREMVMKYLPALEKRVQKLMHQLEFGITDAK